MPNAVLIVAAQRGRGTRCRTVLSAFGLEAQHCTSGKRALAVLRTGAMRPLLIVDAELPDMTGYELLRTVRTLWPATAVILMREDGVASGELQLIRPGIVLLCTRFSDVALSNAAWIAIESLTPPPSPFPAPAVGEVLPVKTGVAVVVQTEATASVTGCQTMDG